MRILRAVIAIWAFAQFMQTNDWMLFFFGSFFALQAIFNFGCCGTSGCATTPKVGKQDFSAQEITYEEVGAPHHHQVKP